MTNWKLIDNFISHITFPSIFFIFFPFFYFFIIINFT